MEKREEEGEVATERGGERGEGGGAATRNGGGRRAEATYEYEKEITRSRD